MNKQARKLNDFLEDNPEFKGCFIGFKYDRGGMGVTRIDNDWYECDNYYIDIDDLIKVLSKTNKPIERE